MSFRMISVQEKTNVTLVSIYENSNRVTLFGAITLVGVEYCIVCVITCVMSYLYFIQIERPSSRFIRKAFAKILALRRHAYLSKMSSSDLKFYIEYTFVWQSWLRKATGIMRVASICICQYIVRFKLQIFLCVLSTPRQSI